VLVIRRRPGESIRIGDEVEIEVIECGPHRVKLGISAPKHVPVVRNEARLTREQNLAAAGAMAGGALSGVLKTINRTAPGDTSS
jgi:carbon storage regulator